MKNWLLYGLIIVLAGLALISWQKSNSLSQVRDAILQQKDYLTASLEQAETKPPEIKRGIAPLASTANVDLDQLILKAKMGEWNHQYYIKNWDLQNSYTGDIRFNQEWIEFYRQIQSILLEIKEKQ